MAGTKNPGEPHEARPQSVARDAHDALPMHRPNSASPALAVGSGHDIEAHEHPSEMVYIKIAAILAVVTAVEVVIYYIEALESVLVPALLLLSAGKFIAVIGYFMHLKFDDKRFTWVFLAGLVISFSVFLGLAAMFLYHTFDVISMNPSE